MASSNRSGGRSDGSGAVPPAQVASVPTPPSDLIDHRGSISYQLGALDATVNRLAHDVRENKTSVDAGFAEQKASLLRIESKIKVEEATVKTAFYASKWFIGVIAAAVVFLIDHWDFVKKHLFG
jgi:hypothetical protein